MLEQQRQEALARNRQQPGLPGSLVTPPTVEAGTLSEYRFFVDRQRRDAESKLQEQIDATKDNSKALREHAEKLERAAGVSIDQQTAPLEAAKSAGFQSFLVGALGFAGGSRLVN